MSTNNYNNKIHFYSLKIAHQKQFRIKASREMKQ